MTDQPITCEIVDRDDIDQRYLAGTLPPADAEAFEEHFFGCERCWALVQRGLAVRAAGAPAAAVRRAARPQWWIGLAAAAVLLVSSALWYGSRTRTPVDAGAERGAGNAIVASALVHGDSIAARWPRVNGAADYRLRISAPDGTALFEGAVIDDSVVIPRGALAGTTSDTLYLSVLARDALGHPLAQSALTPLALPRR